MNLVCTCPKSQVAAGCYKCPVKVTWCSALRAWLSFLPVYTYTTLATRLLKLTLKGSKATFVVRPPKVRIVQVRPIILILSMFVHIACVCIFV